MVSERLSEGRLSPDGTSPSGEWWVFDVDGCLVDSLTGTSLRPGARELLGHLDKRSAGVILWSAGGQAYAMERARQFSIDAFVTGYFGKDSRDADGFYRIDHLPAGVSRCGLRGRSPGRPVEAPRCDRRLALSLRRFP